MNNKILLDAGLEKALVAVSKQHAREIGAFNAATALLDFEKRAIDQGRLCQVASYSDYREYVSLRRPKSFADVSSNAKVRQFLETAYESVDDIEFYVGLLAEDLEDNSPLPPLLLAFVALDAFSQALTNPLLSEHVWKKETFTEAGWEVIHETTTLRDIVHRNVKGGLHRDVFVGMTHPDWRRS